MLYALGYSSVFLPQIREVSLLPHEYASDPTPQPYSDRLRLYLRSIYGQYTYYGAWDREFVNKTPSNAKQGPRMAVGLLAASKRAYRDSCGIYWSTNNFTLAHGSYKHSEYYFDNISPAHIALIRCIVVNLSIADLTQTIIRYVEHGSRQMNSGMTISNDDHMRWGQLATNQLRFMWVQKLQWARKAFSHVDKVAVVCFRSTRDLLYLDGDEFANQVDNIRVRRPSNDLRRLVNSTYQQFRQIIRDSVEEVGWENFKEVLAGKCERELGDQACPFHD